MNYKYSAQFSIYLENIRTGNKLLAQEASRGLGCTLTVTEGESWFQKAYQYNHQYVQLPSCLACGRTTPKASPFPHVPFNYGVPVTRGLALCILHMVKIASTKESFNLQCEFYVVNKRHSNNWPWKAND